MKFERRRIAAALPLLMLLSWASAAGGAELRGRVELTVAGEGERISPDPGDPVVVYFQPARRSAVRPLTPVPEMEAKNREFVPRVLTITTGSTVRFPNRDPILHNVFSVSGGNRFDLGLYRKGPGGSATFESPGTVRVFCNVHREMVGYILVLDTPHSTRVDGRGGFRLTGLPDEAGTLHVWHSRARPWKMELTPGQVGEQIVRLSLSRPRVPSHLNKNGKQYRRGRRGRYP